MSVRRLADDSLQPEKFAFNRAFGAEAKKWIGKYPPDRKASAVIPLLMLAQEQEGWVTRAAIESVADMLDMPYIRVFEVATFYTQFQLAPVGSAAHVQVCGTTPCMLRGAEELIALCRRRIHPEPLHLNAGGTLSWEEVECQGACVNAPMVMISRDTYEDLTSERLAEIIDAFEAGKGDSIAPGTQIDRICSAPAGGLTTLQDEVLASGSAKAKGTARKGDGPTVPPSKAGKPRTEAVETRPAIQSPANGKSPKAGEGEGSKPSPDDPDRPPQMARPAQPDDLKLISGIGPKLERTLHEIGIFTFAQIADWKKAECEWVDGYLNFKGRIERDEWIRQARALAKGGEAELFKVFGKKPR